LYDVSVAIHVIAAIAGFGATFSYPVIQLAAERTNRRALPFAMDAILAISRWVAVPATVLVGVTGVYQVADGPYGVRDTWLAVGILLYVAVMAIGVFLLAPAYRRAGQEARQLIDAAGAGEPIDLSPGYRAAIRRPTFLGPLVAAAIVATAVLMELKPS
jgi:uncharacterized membrane protein